jgi:hypothetical protein
MIDIMVEKAKGFLINPVETFQKSRGDEPGAVLMYLASLLLINAVLSALVAAVGIQVMQMFGGMKFGVAVPVVVFFAVLVGGFILTLIFAAWVHLWVHLLGGRKGIWATIIAIVYANTPRLLLGWIPLVGIIFALWSLVLSILGIRELQEMSGERAVLAVAIAIIIPLIVIILAALWFMTSIVTSTAMMEPPRNILI